MLILLAKQVLRNSYKCYSYFCSYIVYIYKRITSLEIYFAALFVGMCVQII